MMVMWMGSMNRWLFTSSLSPSTVSRRVASFSVVMISFGEGRALKASLMQRMSFCLKAW